MNKLKELIQELEAAIPHQELVNTAVSKASVGWHIEHTLLTMHMIIKTLKNSDSATYKRKFNWSRTLVFTINKIPRGKAKAPSRVQPRDEFTAETLHRHIQSVREKLQELDALEPNNYFEHPFFGHLNLKPTRKFLKIHTAHHLHIIRDIIKSQGKSL